MATTRTKYIGTATTLTIIALLTWFVGSSNFETEIELNDKVCAGDFFDPCEAQFNITSTAFTYYLYNKEGVDLNFVPDVQRSFTCKRDGRFSAAWRGDLSHENYVTFNQAPCGIGWREFNFKDPLTDRYKYIEKFEKGKKKEYKLVVFKNNPDDEIKWGGSITGEDFDPKFLASSDFKSNIKCDITVEYDTCLVDETILRNVTYFNNITGRDHTIIDYQNFTRNKGQLCNPHRINCKTSGVNTSSFEAFCTDRFRCDVINTSFCYVSLDDGDENFDFEQANGRGWEGGCINLSNLREGEIKVSSYRDQYMEVKKR